MAAHGNAASHIPNNICVISESVGFFNRITQPNAILMNETLWENKSQ